MKIDTRCLCSKTLANKLSFEGKTAIVTGAGRGLGREYALLLAARGANVVINDFGGSLSGEKPSNPEEVTQAADRVVDEVSKFKGRAIANYESVSDEAGVERLVKSAIDSFGKVDILINNAGILRDRSFAKMTIADFDAVMQVHLRGSFLLTKQVWPLMKAQNFGRILMTSSISGLMGNFGQANYSAAKMGLVALANTLAIEGAKNNINVNTIVPLAASRMSHDIFTPEFSDKLSPKFIAPLGCWLSHESCNETGGVYEAAGGSFARFSISYSPGKYLPDVCDGDDSLEKVAANWPQIVSTKDSQVIGDFSDYVSTLMNKVNNKN